MGEETRQPNRRVRVLWVATRSRPSDWSVRVVAGRFRAGPAGWSGDEDPWTPLTVLYDPNLPRNLRFAELGGPCIVPIKPTKNKCKTHRLSKMPNPNSC